MEAPSCCHGDEWSLGRHHLFPFIFLSLLLFCYPQTESSAHITGKDRMAHCWKRGFPDRLPLDPYSSLKSPRDLGVPSPTHRRTLMRHESCQVDVVGDPFLSCQYAAAAYSFSPSINISRAVSRGDIHILDHVCSLCLGYGMPISRHAQTLDVQNPHDRLCGAARPIPSLQVIQSMYRQHSNHDPFGVSPVLAAPIFPAHHQQVRPSTIRGCTPPTRAGAESRCPHPTIALTARAYFVIASG